MVKKLLEWFKVTHDIEGLKINVKQFKKKLWNFLLLMILEHQKDGLKNLKKDIKLIFNKDFF